VRQPKIRWFSQVLEGIKSGKSWQEIEMKECGNTDVTVGFSSIKTDKMGMIE
jgi:hypothetical protein